ncbi:MAG: hypothetical protein AAF721_35735 [Myxococcota bacterium]
MKSLSRWGAGGLAVSLAGLVGFGCRSTTASFFADVTDRAQAIGVQIGAAFGPVEPAPAQPPANRPGSP